MDWNNEWHKLPPFNEAEWQAVTDGQVFLWLYGAIHYHDVYGTLRSTRFRWAYNGLADIFAPDGDKPYNERT